MTASAMPFVRADAATSPGLLLMGPPGAGKSTVVQGLLGRHGTAIRHFGVRSFFLEEIRTGTALGHAAQPYVERRAWMPDELVCAAVERALPPLLATFCVIEGFPATPAQATWLLAFLKERRHPRLTFAYVDVPDDVCFRRSRVRLRCPRCNDDKHLAASAPVTTCGSCGAALEPRPDDDERFFLERLAKHRHLQRQIRRSYGEPDVVVDGTLDRATVLSLVESLVPSRRLRSEIP